MNVTNSVTTAGAAELASVTEGAIRAAIRRGELTPVETHCQRARLLSVAAVRKWAKSERKSGPKAG